LQSFSRVSCSLPNRQAKENIVGTGAANLREPINREYDAHA
jgi:hypothetical protein